MHPLTSVDKMSKMIPITADESGKLPAEIEILQTGMWDAPYHGQFMVTSEDLSQYVDNFNADVRPSSSVTGLPIDEEHDGQAALGWMKNLEVRANSRGGDSLWAKTNWTSLGKEKLLGGIYKFFSPEFVPKGYIDPEGKHEACDNVLIGGGLTNRPLFKGLTPVMASDGTAQQQASEAEDDKLYISVKEQPVELEDIRKKPATDLTDEERKVLADNQEQLTDEEKVTFGFNAAATEKTEEEKAAEAKALEDAAAAKAAEEDEATKLANEKGGSVTISASELEAFRAAVKTANELRAENDAIKAADHIQKLNDEKHVFKAGELGDVTAFYSGLSTDQKKAFNETIVPAISASAVVTGEIGDSKVSGGQSTDAIIKKANDLAKSENISIGEATRRVVTENAELAKSHETELINGGTN
jgi:hypothetical protein